MPYRWDEHIAVAEHILAGGNYSSKAATRNAISRAYYAAFCQLRDWAEANTTFRAFGDAEDRGRLTDHFRAMGQRDGESRCPNDRWPDRTAPGSDSGVA